MLEYQENIDAIDGSNINFTVIDAENTAFDEKIICTGRLRHRWTYPDLIANNRDDSCYIRDCQLDADQICKLMKNHERVFIYHNNDIMLDTQYLLENMPENRELRLAKSVMLSYPYDYIVEHYHGVEYTIHIRQNGISIKR